jgi:putative transposase
MSDRFKGIYRNGTNRLIGYDYGSSNHYFITICVKGRLPVFGKISDSVMHLSPLGICAENEWKKSIQLRPDTQIELGEFIVMPDHFHAIITIGENEFNREFSPNSMGIQSQNIGSIIRGFKAAVTTYARINNIPFEWQSRYYDRIIRDETEYENVEKYIRNNVINWKPRPS